MASIAGYLSPRKARSDIRHTTECGSPPPGRGSPCDPFPHSQGVGCFSEPTLRVGRASTARPPMNSDHYNFSYRVILRRWRALAPPWYILSCALVLRPFSPHKRVW